MFCHWRRPHPPLACGTHIYITEWWTCCFGSPPWLIEGSHPQSPRQLETFGPSLTKLTALLPQSHAYSCYVGQANTDIPHTPALWLHIHHELRFRVLAHSVDLWRYPRLANFACAWSWRICGINLAILSGTFWFPLHQSQYFTVLYGCWAIFVTDSVIKQRNTKYISYLVEDRDVRLWEEANWLLFEMECFSFQSEELSKSWSKIRVEDVVGHNVYWMEYRVKFLSTFEQMCQAILFQILYW